jgi:hypothetical protein
MCASPSLEGGGRHLREEVAGGGDGGAANPISRLLIGRPPHPDRRSFAATIDPPPAGEGDLQRVGQIVPDRRKMFRCWEPRPLAKKASRVSGPMQLENS